jgi:Zn-dependent peptidase ImmA (M78 family)
MYRLSVQDFLLLISEGLKNPITSDEIFSDEIKVSYLKRIDKVFEKGLHYYLDPKLPESSKDASVFFRKENFATDDLNIGAIKIVNKFEELKISLSAIAKLSDLDFKRKFPTYSIKQDPKEVASIVRNKLYPAYNSNRRDFLKALISKFAESNILVFEFIETWNKKDKANIDGFYLKPNMIVLKRHQSFRREIFTLAHELGHFLIEEEEIEELDYQKLGNRNLSKIERWCNDFAYYFLVGPYANSMDSLDFASEKNDYHFTAIKSISEKTHLSQIALYTRLLFKGQISQSNYSKVKFEFDEIFRKRQEEKERERQKLIDLGIKKGGSVAKPIPSPLFISTIQTAFYEGVLNEYEVCKKLNIKPENLNKYIP